MANRKIVFVLNFLIFVRLAFTKECTKKGRCQCEMSDGSGIIDLTKIDNKDGDPKFKNIRSNPSIGSQIRYSFNPCTPISTMPGCNSNLCQRNTGTSKDASCGLPDPVFTIDEVGNVVMNFKEAANSNSAKITLVCDSSVEQGSFGNGISYDWSTSGIVFTGQLTAKYACAFPSTASGLSAGSILLIIFFTVLVLYLIVGIIFNVKVKNKQSIPEVFPNHEFWADCPFLVKDGCVFSFHKLKSCCSFLFAKATGDGSSSYSSI